MFYPVESLKRGGRFYICWVADSWPLRFAAITHRQLWSNDIRKLCDDLLEVMTNESGRPTNRFSLRLSSQLMRGIVRLYERKVTVLLGDLCMIHANVFKSSNKKFGIHEIHERPLRSLPQLPVAPVVPDEAPVNEQRLEELIQNSGNVVSNIQDITLKEAAIPDFRLPPNDGFGEENPDQPLQNLLADRTLEMMLVQETSGAQISGLDLPVEDKSHDKSRPAYQAPQMEGIGELDVTRKSTVEDVPPVYEKDIPEIPVIPPPEVPVPNEPVPIEPVPIEPVPLEPIVPEQPEEIAIVTEQAKEAAETTETRKKQREKEPEIIELEELEEQPQAKRRRGKTKLIVDKRIKLSNDFLRARIDNIKVDLRFEDFSDAIVSLHTPADTLLKRPASGGARVSQAASWRLAQLFQRNLGFVHVDRPEEQHREVEEQRAPRTTRSIADKTLEPQEPLVPQPETQEPLVPQPEPQEPLIPQPEPPMVETNEQLNATRRVPSLNATLQAPNITLDAVNIFEVSNVAEGAKDPINVFGDVPNVSEQIVQDIADLPTQKLETLSQAQKRTSEEDGSPPKRLRSAGHMTFRKSQGQRNQEALIPEIIVHEVDKENIPPNTEEPSPKKLQKTSSKHVSTMLEEAGLADLQQGVVPVSAQVQVEVQVESQRRKEGSESSETPLGSLDRTKVSLGDSVQTTDSQRFIRQEWGIEGTMMKILRMVRAGAGRGAGRGAGALDVRALLASGPRLAGHARLVAARCFTSLLKLKQHGFIRIDKNPETLEIENISLGPRFDSL